MIDTQRATAALQRRYQNLEPVTESVFRAFESYEGNPYAVKYFDLSDDLISAADNLHQYQDKLLGARYFDSKAESDLRWNYYLYFITSRYVAQQPAFTQAKERIESDREYARKQVIREDEIDRVLERHDLASLASQKPPPDLLSVWLGLLEVQSLGFVLDSSRTIPAIARIIVAGDYPKIARGQPAADLSAAERVAGQRFLDALEIVGGFRKYPIKKNFVFGEVNLITGANASGKTSLLEAIEYLYCGRLRRNSTPLDTEITGWFLGSEAKLTTSSRTHSKQLRARNLVWYAQSEIRSVKIENSFAKFNFLNTDAAVSLSVEVSREQIRDDVAALLLGPEAAQAFDRIRRVGLELGTSERDLAKELDSLRTQQRYTSERVAALKKTAKVSDGLFVEMNRALEQAGWIRNPPGKTDTGQLSESLAQAIAQTQLLGRLSIGSSPFLEGALAADEGSLKQAAKRVTDLEKRENVARNRASDAEAELRSHQERLDALTNLSAYIAADFETLVERKKVLESSIRLFGGVLVATREVSFVKFREGVLAMAIEEAISEGHKRLFQVRAELADARRELEVLDRSQASLTSLQQQLRSLAQRILSQTPDLERCPLCHTQFEKGELMEHMLFQADSTAEANSARLRKRVLENEELETTVSIEVRALDTLARIVEQLGLGRSTVSQARDRLLRADEQFQANESELRTISSRYSDLEAAGLTASRLSELKAKSQIEGRLPTEPEAAVLRRACAQSLEEFVQIENMVRKEIVDVEKACIAEALQFGSGSIQSPRALTAYLTEQITSHERAREAVALLRKLVRLNPSVSLTELTVQLERAQSLLLQMNTAVARESETDDDLAQATKSLEVIQESMNAKQARLTRAKIARSLLNDLQTKHSPQAITAEILLANWKEIGTIFAGIHSPNEFDLRQSEDGLQIFRHSSGELADVNEMSTGQRAAYALSLFLAMNASLKEGPKVLLFDDPIAHVDDINMLSFLDYLRDLAMTNTRQIFFATADTKLAGLFRHKFRFLGEKRFREIALARQE